MGTAQLITVMPGVTVRLGARGKTIRFAAMVSGERHTKTLDLPAEIFLTDKNGPTRELRAEYGKWVAGLNSDAKAKAFVGLRVPSCDELIAAYEDIASKRVVDPRFKMSERSVETAIKNFRYCLDASGCRAKDPYTKLVDFDTVRKIADSFMGRGLTGVTAWSYIASLQSVTAKWTIVNYRDKGYDVTSQVIPKQSLFGTSADPAQYVELPPELIAKIWSWYSQLQDGIDASASFFAICMLELAIRPSDIGRLTAENFPLGPDGRRRLSYKPHKTRESSNRRVDIPIPDALYQRLYALKRNEFEGGGRLCLNILEVEGRVNRSMRESCDMPVEKYNKACYELRKLCVHTIINTPVEEGGGVDQAVRLSGDRRDTIEKYYCDPYKSHTTLPTDAFAKFAEKMTA